MNSEIELNTYILIIQNWKDRMEGHSLSEKEDMLKSTSCLHFCKEKEGN